MTERSDYHDEMRKPRPLSDREIEDFFAGRTLPGEDLLNSFAQSARVSSTGPAPLPMGELARILADGLTTDKGDLPVTAASKANGPHREASALPKWRRPIMATSTFLTALFSKVGMASAAAKAGLTAAVAAGALTAAGAAGALPAPVQNALSHAISDISPVNLPTVGSQSHPSGRPASPGLNGLNRANTTPAAGHAPTSVPAPTHPSAPAQAGPAGGPPSSPGSQSSTGLGQANTTPAAGHAPTSVPTPTNPGSQSGAPTNAPTNAAPPAGSGTQSSTGGSSTGSTHTSSIPTKP